MLVLIMLFALEFFKIETYVQEGFIHAHGLAMVREIYDSKNGETAYIPALKKLEQKSKSAVYPTISIEVWEGNKVVYDYSSDTNYKDLRDTEYQELFTQSERKVNGYYTKFFLRYSIRKVTRIEGLIGLCRTIFICFVLAIGSIFFASDANKLVLNPIERMLEKVKFIAKNPLAAASEEVDQAGVMSLMHKVDTKDKKKGSDDAEYET